MAELVGRLHLKRTDITDAQFDEIVEAVTLQACDYIPDKSPVVVEQGEEIPLVLSATDSHIYALNVMSVSEDGPVTTSCRLLGLNPATISASVAVRYGTSNPFGAGRLITWRFQIRDAGGTLDVTIPGRMDHDGEMDDRARLGNHIAVRLGWGLDDRHATCSSS